MNTISSLGVKSSEASVAGYIPTLGSPSSYKIYSYSFKERCDQVLSFLYAAPVVHLGAS